MYRACVCIAFVFSLIYSADSLLHAEMEKDEKQKLELVMKGLDDTILHINSGICQISGNSSYDHSSIDENVKIAFDYSGGFYRFDRDDDKRSLKTPDHYYEYFKSRDYVSRQNLPDRKVSQFIKPFDIHALGFFNLVGPFWNKDYQTERQKITTDRPVLLEESDGVFIITVERNPNTLNFSPVLRRYVVNSKQGFSLIRVEFGDYDIVELSWKEMNKVWVPTSFNLSSTNGMSAAWKIDWLLVNEPVPEEYFDPTLLADDITLLISKELGDPVIVGQIGKGIPMPELPQAPNADEKVHYLRYILMIPGLLLILVAVGKKFYDARAARSGNSA